MLILFEVLMLHGYVVKCNDHYRVSVVICNYCALCLILSLHLLSTLVSARDKLILNQKESLHCVVQGQLMLAHLRKNRTDI